MDDLQNLTSFEDVEQWITTHRRVLWHGMFPDDPMPEGFMLLNLTMGEPKYQDRLMFDTGGFAGTLKFTSTYRTTLSQSVLMFKPINIVIRRDTSFVIENERGFQRAVENNLHTHTLRYHMFADDWLNLSVFQKLSCL